MSAPSHWGFPEGRVFILLPQRQRGHSPRLGLVLWVSSSPKLLATSTSTSASLTILKSLCGSQQTVENCSREEIPDHLTCFLRNLYVGPIVAVRTGHRAMDWFQIGKGVCQGCILLPCFSSVQFTSVAQSCLTLCNPIDCSMPGLPVHRQLL